MLTVCAIYMARNKHGNEAGERQRGSELIVCITG